LLLSSAAVASDRKFAAPVGLDRIQAGVRNASFHGNRDLALMTGKAGARPLTSAMPTVRPMDRATLITPCASLHAAFGLALLGLGDTFCFLFSIEQTFHLAMGMNQVALWPRSRFSAV
jgi:hypothetical protein